MIDKEIKRYRKFQKKYIKELVKLAKADRGFDWSFMVDILLHMLKGRLTYYKNGDNVWQSEESLNEIVMSLEEAIRLLEYAYDDSNFSFDDVKEYFANLIDNPTPKENGVIDLFETCPKHTKEEYKEMAEKENNAWIEAFNYIGKYIRYWWD